ncbi:hypothetical protein M441DRAFT_224743 [Trichoderma asperellum CBS 433.97]|uniref:Uncharacterized protein n=1 Tax=Trichoderma asperellum (strain ATCC 204424 / CBS 433.97 / NBRC 101777) TaxID=1042311 RepID=A0A2T3ZPT6_TRIA4|nr:hypothetical protein M441DRAFT_224743 [Trichoderma asperellum CBS 433.97]PTB46799.1 hypothetical protein M441DRAFT_224743 [Trichoderma asperellum CBS 433.97]
MYPEAELGVLGYLTARYCLLRAVVGSFSCKERLCAHQAQSKHLISRSASGLIAAFLSILFFEKSVEMRRYLVYTRQYGPSVNRIPANSSVNSVCMVLDARISLENTGPPHIYESHAQITRPQTRLFQVA